MSIKIRRKQKGITQQELAEKLGVKQSTVSSWELGTREPCISAIKQLAAIFECSIDELLSDEGSAAV